MISVRKAIEIGGLKKGVVIAGHGGLDKQISSVSVLEATSSEVANWIRGGELFITSFYSIADDIDKQLNIIRILAQRSCSGLVICSLGFWLKQVSEEVISLANNLNLPLILVPSDMAYVDIITPLMDEILKIEKEKLLFASNVQKQLYDVILADKDVHDLLSTLGSIIKKRLALFDSDNICISKHKVKSEEIPEIKQIVKRNIVDFRNPSPLWVSQKKVLIYPIILTSQYYGYLVILDMIDKDEKILLTIGQAIIAIGLMFTKKKRFEDMKDTLKRDFIADLMTWNFSNETVAHTRAKSFGWDLTNKHLLLICNIDNFNDLNKQNKAEGSMLYAKNFILPKIEEIILNDNSKNLVGLRSDLIIVLLEGKEDEKNLYKRAKKLGDRIIKYAKDNQLFISIGICNYFGKIQDISKGYKEAIKAIKLGRKIFGRGNCIFYSDLGVYTLLDQLANRESTKKIVDQALERLKEYDLQTKSSLLQTLEKLIEHNGNMQAVSDELYLHKNTIFYRKNKITSLLGHDPLLNPYRLMYEIIFTLEKLKEA
ncbi:MAG: PucR family transcriptional regulator [Tepidanaerobacteraceae bacterium]|jgi:purine catabolism regulator